MTPATRTRLALAAGPAVAYVTLMALVAVFLVKPPPLGWLGFAIVAAVGVGLIFAAFTLFPGSRTNVDPVPDDRRRDAVLVLADTTCAPGQLRQGITRICKDATSRCTSSRRFSPSRSAT